MVPNFGASDSFRFFGVWSRAALTEEADEESSPGCTIAIGFLR